MASRGQNEEEAGFIAGILHPQASEPLISVLPSVTPTLPAVLPSLAPELWAFPGVCFDPCPLSLELLTLFPVTIN